MPRGNEVHKTRIFPGIKTKPVNKQKTPDESGVFLSAKSVSYSAAAGGVNTLAASSVSSIKSP